MEKVHKITIELIRNGCNARARINTGSFTEMRGSSDLFYLMGQAFDEMSKLLAKIEREKFIKPKSENHGENS